ncbi:MAG: CCDC90 family protein [Leptospirales bacterium]
MDTVLFDTHAYVRRLQMGGLSSEQAEAHADALLLAMRGGTLTKIDIQEFEGRVKDELHLHSLDRKIEAVRSELKKEDLNTSRREFREMETRMTLNFGLMLAAGLCIFLTLEKFLK